MIARRLLIWLCAFALAAGWSQAALAHEVRPALVQIVESGPGDYDVTWKRPVVGDMALRLVPHLSGGALDKPPTGEQAAPGYVSRVWRVRGAKLCLGRSAALSSA